MLDDRDNEQSTSSLHRQDLNKDQAGGHSGRFVKPDNQRPNHKQQNQKGFKDNEINPFTNSIRLKQSFDFKDQSSFKSSEQIRVQQKEIRIESTKIHRSSLRNTNKSEYAKRQEQEKRQQQAKRQEQAKRHTYAKRQSQIMSNRQTYAKRQSQIMSNKSSKLNFVQRQQSFQFPRRSTKEKEKQSAQFQFAGNDSGSLFGSHKSQVQNEPAILNSKNLQNYTKLLKQYYNQSYLHTKSQQIRKSSVVHSSSIRRSQIPYFITREPITFRKKFEGVRSAHGLSGNYMCRLIQNKIYYKNVMNDELLNFDYLKCECITLRIKQNISPSLEIDANSMHLFYYSNTHNQIVVLSLSKSRKTNKEICRIKTRTQRKNPLLYLIAINKQTILLLIGGYVPFNKSKSEQVEGCKYIEVFSVDKWGTEMIKSRLIKLINGKIYPLIVFPVKIQQNDSILLVGGNTIGEQIGNTLSFKNYKVLNRSSNVRGVYLNTKQIIECLEQSKDILSLPHGSSISVQVEDKVNLYSGYVDYVKSNHKQKIRLFLPKMREFYTMKIIKKQVRIIKSKQNQQRRLTFAQSDSYHHLQMKCLKKPTAQYYEINTNGFLQVKKINLANITEFSSRSHIRCPCQFM